MDPLFLIPEDFSALTDEELQQFVDASRETVQKANAAPDEFISEGRSATEFLEEMTAGVAAIEEARAELKKREAVEAKPEEGEAEEVEGEPETAAVDREALAALAARVADEPAEPEEPEATPAEPVEAELKTGEPTTLGLTVKVDASEIAPAVAEAVTAALTASAEKEKPAQLRRPARSRSAEPPVEDQPRVAMTAAGENLGIGLGAEFPDDNSIAEALIKRRHEIGDVPEGTHGDKVPVARARWKDLYSQERTLVASAMGDNMRKIEAVVDEGRIRAEMERRKEIGGSLVASGGLCAPVTPYYQLQMISVAERPLRAALPSFAADRGGLRFARPATLATVVGDNAVGIITEANDAAGGTFATKHCQVISCPSFSEVDVDAIYHCLQFGNLGARAFPELVAQWQSLSLAAQARVAETHILDAIATASTAVTASNALTLGAGAQLLSQIVTAGAGLRSRHRMDPDAVLRVLLPDWTLELLVSDTYRTQFNRFSMSEDDFVALLRENDIEPTFYIDGPTSGGQVFGTQSAGALLKFPSTVHWYMYPEGSFLFLDGGQLELGLVRDSVLNATNDFQIFGETWENVAFIGVESLAVTTTVDDRGAVAAAVAAGATSYA